MVILHSNGNPNEDTLPGHNPPLTEEGATEEGSLLVHLLAYNQLAHRARDRLSQWLEPSCINQQSRPLSTDSATGQSDQGSSSIKALSSQERQG